MVEKILKIYRDSDFDFRKYASPEDPLLDLFEEWIGYYRMKHSIAQAIKPKTVFEMGVRYGYSAITFLDASPQSRYTGIDHGSDSFGGSQPALAWAKKITQEYQAEFITGDSQTLETLPGDHYDLVHVDGQQDADETFRDLELALEKASWILLDGYLWTPVNMLSATQFIQKYQSFIEYYLVIPGYAGELLIKTARNVLIPALKKERAHYAELADEYDRNYFLYNCGGHVPFKKEKGLRLSAARLNVILNIASPLKGKRVLDIGCGRGELAFAMAKQGATVIGIDYSEAAIRIANDTFSGQAVELTFQQEDLFQYQPEEKFDIITATDFVEHINSDLLPKAFDKIRDLLTEEGRFFIHTAPNLLNYRYEYNVRREKAKELGLYLPANPRSFDEDRMHINEQTPSSLSRVLNKCFPESLVWAPYPDMVGSLARGATRQNMKMAGSILAVASLSQIVPGDLIDKLTQPKLPREEMDIRIELVDAPEKARPGAGYQLTVIIHNNSPYRLSGIAPQPVALSYHWENLAETSRHENGIRTPLEAPIEPGGEARCTMNLKAPAQPGRYRVEVSLIQVGCFWLDSYCSDLPVSFALEIA